MRPSLRRVGIVVVALALVVTAAVLIAVRDGGGPPGPSTSPGPPLGETALRYRLDNRFRPIFFCDPDFYPIESEGGERTNARAWWATTRGSGEEAKTILAHLGLSSELTGAEILRTYREHKRLATIGLDPADAGFRFTLRSGQEANAVQITGTIARDGTIRVERQEPANTSCPICLAPGTRIDTPNGEVPVTDVGPGMAVWTVDESGRRVTAEVLSTAHRDTGSVVLLVRVGLADGRSVVASAAHPTFDGSVLGALKPGETLDGSIVVSVEVIAAPAGITYDLLPSGSTGAYWANGVLLTSTLHERPSSGSSGDVRRTRLSR